MFNHQRHLVTGLAFSAAFAGASFLPGQEPSNVESPVATSDGGNAVPDEQSNRSPPPNAVPDEVNCAIANPYAGRDAHRAAIEWLVAHSAAQPDDSALLASLTGAVNASFIERDLKASALNSLCMNETRTTLLFEKLAEITRDGESDYSRSAAIALVQHGNRLLGINKQAEELPGQIASENEMLRLAKEDKDLLVEYRNRAVKGLLDLPAKDLAKIAATFAAAQVAVKADNDGAVAVAGHGAKINKLHDTLVKLQRAAAVREGQFNEIKEKIRNLLEHDALDDDRLLKSAIQAAYLSFLGDEPFELTSDAPPGSAGSGTQSSSGNQTMAVTERLTSTTERLGGITEQQVPNRRVPGGNRAINSTLANSGSRENSGRRGNDPSITVEHQDPADRATGASGAVVTRVNVTPFDEL